MSYINCLTLQYTYYYCYDDWSIIVMKKHIYNLYMYNIISEKHIL